MLQTGLAENPQGYAFTDLGTSLTAVERLVPRDVWYAMTDQERTAFANMTYGSPQRGSSYTEHDQFLRNLADMLVQRYGRRQP
jgi:hypothetical protein